MPEEGAIYDKIREIDSQTISRLKKEGKAPYVRARYLNTVRPIFIL